MKVKTEYPRGFLVALFLLLMGTINLDAQDTINVYGVVDTISLDFDIFTEEDPASITLAFNIKEFLRNSDEDKYFDARLTYLLDDSAKIEKDIRIKARGKNRRDVCSFPPLWLNIGKADIDNKYFGDVKKIKLVTHCNSGNVNSANVLKEYLVYKMYNILSPYSFRVRLVKVKYIDTGKDNKEIDTWGFLIEPEEMVAQRLNAYALDYDHIGYELADQEETDIMSMFQYIIGNADYSILSRQNVKLLKLNDIDRPQPIPVPYDFDYSGFVNPAYAIPGDNLGISSVTERYFLGPCRSVERYNELFEYFFSKKEEIYRLIESFGYLDDRTKKVALKFLDSFFMYAGKKGYIENNLLPTCRGVKVK